MKKRLDNKLYVSFHRGEEAAFKSIFKLFYPEIRYFTFRLTSNMPEAEDITSTTFEKLFRLHKVFDNPDNIRAFLYKTARNHCFDYLRKEKARKTLPMDFPDPEEEFQMEEAEIYGRVETQILKDIFDMADKLPEQCRKVFKMVYCEGKSTNDIAAEMGVTPETVRSHKRRAIELLRISLDSKMEMVLFIFSLYFLHR